jgi:SsrA-binding protein
MAKTPILIENKRAYHDYEIIDKFEAGLVLNGQEVKSIKSGRINLNASYVVFYHQPGSELHLIGASIPPYQPKNAPKNYDEKRSRKLLLRKKEIRYLEGKSGQKGLTFIPLKVYTLNGKIKLEFALARGKKAYDKRDTLKKRDIKREIEGALKIRG